PFILGVKRRPLKSSSFWPPFRSPGSGSNIEVRPLRKSPCGFWLFLFFLFFFARGPSPAVAPHPGACPDILIIHGSSLRFSRESQWARRGGFKTSANGRQLREFRDRCGQLSCWKT